MRTSFPPRQCCWKSLSTQPWCRFFEQFQSFGRGSANARKSAIFAGDLEPLQTLRAPANSSQSFKKSAQRCTDKRMFRIYGVSARKWLRELLPSRKTCNVSDHPVIPACGRWFCSIFRGTIFSSNCIVSTQTPRRVVAHVKLECRFCVFP